MEGQEAWALRTRLIFIKDHPFLAGFSPGSAPGGLYVFSIAQSLPKNESKFRMTPPRLGKGIASAKADISGGGMRVERAYFKGDGALLPRDIHCPETAEALAARPWDLLALTAEGCRLLCSEGREVACGTLLLPGEEPLPPRLRAERVVTYGLSHRDTLTLSSLGEMPVLCLQRALTPEAGPELDARELPLTAEKLLLLYGLWLLG